RFLSPAPFLHRRKRRRSREETVRGPPPLPPSRPGRAPARRVPNFWNSGAAMFATPLLVRVIRRRPADRLRNPRPARRRRNLPVAAGRRSRFGSPPLVPPPAKTSREIGREGYGRGARRQIVPR